MSAIDQSFAQVATLNVMSALSNELMKYNKTDAAITKLAQCILNKNLPAQPTQIHFKYKATEIDVKISKTGELIGYEYNNTASSVNFLGKVERDGLPQQFIKYDWTAAPAKSRSYSLQTVAQYIGEGMGSVVTMPVTATLAFGRTVFCNVTDQFTPSGADKTAARVFASVIIGFVVWFVALSVYSESQKKVL